MTHTHTEVLGLGETVIEQLDKEKANLEKGGMNVTVAKTTLALAVEEAKAAHAQQESLKHQLSSATQLTVAKIDRAYVTTSGTIDMMMAAVQKTSNVAKVFQRLRSKLRRPDEDAAVLPLPVPVHEATQ
jgi:hypothetical protein